MSMPDDRDVERRMNEVRAAECAAILALDDDLPMLLPDEAVAMAFDELPMWRRAAPMKGIY